MSSPAPDASTHVALPDRLPPVERLLAERSLVVMDGSGPSGEPVIAVYDRESSARIATVPNLGQYVVLDDEHILLRRGDATDDERWTLLAPRLGIPEIVAVLTANPGSHSQYQVLGVHDDELIYLEHVVASLDQFSLKLHTRSLRDLRPVRTLDLTKSVQAGSFPPTARLWKRGYATITVDDGAFAAHPLFVVDLHHLAVRRLGVSVGNESVYEVGPRDELAVMVKPGGPIHILELAGQRRSRKIGLAGAAKEGGPHDLAEPCMSFDAEGNRVVVSGGISGKTAWYDLRSNTLIHRDDGVEFWGDTIDGCDGGFTPSERFVFEADRHGALRVFDAVTGQLQFAHYLSEKDDRHPMSNETHWKTRAQICPNHRCLVVRWDTGKTVLVDLETGTLEAQ